jgi:MraZ protein
MLIGEYISQVGEKSRVAIPKKLRENLVGKIYLTRGFENSLILVDSSKWQSLLELISEKSILDKDARDLKRFIVGGTVEVEPDAQGRFVLNEQLKKFAEINEQVIFLGIGDWIEIWDSKIWEENLNNLRNEVSDKAQKLAKND